MNTQISYRSRPTPIQSNPRKSIWRVRLFFAVVAIILGVFWVRSFYLQVIRHDYYVQAARSDQLKEYQIPASRGIIKAHSGDGEVAVVLNQSLYTVYTDPTLVKNVDQVAETLASTLGGHASDYIPKLTKTKTRYVVLAKRLDVDQKDAILKHKYPGVGAQEVPYRTYPNGQLASQVLGFVNDEASGVYGIEEALDKRLSGTPGLLKAVTDVNGVPLAANQDNVELSPKSGDDILLTIDITMQKRLEEILKAGLERAISKSGSAVIMDPNNGAIKAMANWPSFDPNNYSEVEDPSVFNNSAVSYPLEVGSVMKPLTTAAALDMGVISSSTTYYDPAIWEIDGYKITNVEGGRTPGQRTIGELLNLSINTGATWLLMQMSGSGGNSITKEGRQRWHDYMVNHYRFGQLTGIEQGYEASGDVPDPNKGYARDLVYANTTFGQAMTATPLQMAAAYSAMINGGTYYRPRLVDQIISADGRASTIRPEILAEGVVSPKVSAVIRPLLEYVVANHSIRPAFDQSLYGVGGKTGTAQIADPNGAGGYKEHDFNGTYVGYVGGDKPQFVISILVREPKIGGYAGGAAAQPIFGNVGHMLIDNFDVTPKGH